MSRTFSETDALLLFTLLYTRKPASVDGIQSALESVCGANISIPEINDCLSRLDAAKITLKVPSGWTLSDSVWSLNDKIDEQYKLEDDFSPDVGLRVTREFLNRDCD